MISSNASTQHHPSYPLQQRPNDSVHRQQVAHESLHTAKRQHHHPYPTAYSQSRRSSTAMEEDDDNYDLKLVDTQHFQPVVKYNERGAGERSPQSQFGGTTYESVPDRRRHLRQQSAYPSLTEEDDAFSSQIREDADEEARLHSSSHRYGQLPPNQSGSLAGPTSAVITDYRRASFEDAPSTISLLTSHSGPGSAPSSISGASSDTASISGSGTSSLSYPRFHASPYTTTSSSSSTHSSHLPSHPTTTTISTSTGTYPSTSSSVSPSALPPHPSTTTPSSVATARIVTPSAAMGGPGMDPGPAPVPELTLPPLRAWTDQVMQRPDGNSHHSSRMNHHPLRTQSSDPHLHASSMMHRQHPSSPSHIFHHSPTLSHVGSINSSSGSSNSGTSAIHHHSSDHHTHSRYSTSSIASLPDLYMSSSSAPSSTTTSSSLSRVDSLSSLDYHHGTHHLRQSQSSYHRHHPSTAGSITTTSSSTTSSQYGVLSHSSAASNLARANLNAAMASASQGGDIKGGVVRTKSEGPETNGPPSINASNNAVSGQTNTTNTAGSTANTAASTGRTRTTGSAGSEQGRNSTKRAAQNRAAQRAFRQRKDLYVKELERKAELLQVAEGKILHLMTRNRELESALAAVTQHSGHLPPQHPNQQPGGGNGGSSMSPVTSMTTPPPPPSQHSTPHSMPNHGGGHGQGSPSSPSNNHQASPTSGLVGPAQIHAGNSGPKSSAAGGPPPSSAMTGVIHANGSREADREVKREREWEWEREREQREREKQQQQAPSQQHQQHQQHHDGGVRSGSNDRSYNNGMDRDMSSSASSWDREMRERELEWDRDRDREREIEWHRERERDRSMIHEQKPRYSGHHHGTSGHPSGHHYPSQHSDPSQPTPPPHPTQQQQQSVNGYQGQQHSPQGGDYNDTYMDYRPAGANSYTSSPPSLSGAPVRPTLNHYHSAHQLRHYGSIHSPSSPPLSAQTPTKFSSMEP